MGSRGRTISSHRSQVLHSTLPWLALVAFALLSTVMALRSDGAMLDDDLCHYEFARSSWHLPKLLINSWGRPGCTIPYALVAEIGSSFTGMKAARLLSMSMATLTIGLAWRTARSARTPFASWVPMLMLLIPEFFAESFTPCTEIPAALYTSAGACFLSSGSRRLAAVCFAILPATRHELAPFLIPLGLYFLLKRDFTAAILLGWFEAAWAVISWLLGQDQPILRFFTAQDSSAYGSGHFYHYFLMWMKMAGPVMALLCITGAVAVVRHESWRMNYLRAGHSGRRSRLRLLIVGGSIGLVTLETLLYSFNRFASGGYSTFLVPAAPLMALCACYGIAVLKPILNKKWIATGATIAVVHLGFHVHPYLLTAHQQQIQHTIAGLKKDHPGCHIVGNSVWITYFDEISPGARDLDAPGTWAANRVSQLYFIFSGSPGDGLFTRISSFPHQIERIVELDGQPDLYVFRRLSGPS